MNRMGIVAMGKTGFSAGFECHRVKKSDEDVWATYGYQATWGSADWCNTKDKIEGWENMVFLKHASMKDAFLFLIVLSQAFKLSLQ